MFFSKKKEKNYLDVPKNRTFVNIKIDFDCFFFYLFFFLVKELALAPNSKSFEIWKKPPLKLNFDIYLFNWTNPCNLSTEDYVKPILQQVGPYRFREIPTKTKIKWHSSNSTISYRRKSTYYFVEEESAGRLDDTIVTINAVAVVCSDLLLFSHNFLLDRIRI